MYRGTSSIIPNQNGHSAGLWTIGPGVIQPVYAGAPERSRLPKAYKKGKQMGQRRGRCVILFQPIFPADNRNSPLSPSPLRARRLSTLPASPSERASDGGSPSGSWARSGKARSKRKSDVRAKDDSDGASPIAVHFALRSVAAMAAAIPSPGDVASNRPAPPLC